MIPYEFNPEDAERFALERGIQARRYGDELRFAACPYCGKKEGFFAINLKTGAFNCKRASCGAKGNMLTLHKDFGFDLGRDLRNYEKARTSITWQRFNERKPEKIEPTSAALDYLKGRGIPEDIIRRYEITTHKQNDKILVFPFCDEAGNLKFIKYRKTDFDKKRDNSKEWCEKNMLPILFGMKQCEDFGQLVLTEGQIDSLSVAAAGIKNACSVPNGKNGMTWIGACWDWLQKFDSFVVFGDFENGKMTLLDDMVARFDFRVKAVQPEDYRGCKDANEILQRYGKEAIQEAVKNAIPVKPLQVCDLADVEYEDGTGNERMATGLVLLDELLDGGLPFGFVDILTGKRGEGKSTLGSMIIKSALEQGYNVFIYSGEMRKGDVRKWLDMQIAGPANIDVIEKPLKSGRKAKQYSLPRFRANIVREWYRGRAFIYDTSQLTNEKRPLESIIEQQIKQYNCRFILIDNLMMSIGHMTEGSTKFEKQETTVKTLASLAQKYNAIILLVAHKRKTDPRFASDENDDVLGASEITNLAGIVLSYERTRAQDDKFPRVVKVTKNRLTGNIDLKGIGCWFDEQSKRIGTELDNRMADGGPFCGDSTLDLEMPF